MKLLFVVSELGLRFSQLVARCSSAGIWLIHFALSRRGGNPLRGGKICAYLRRSRSGYLVWHSWHSVKHMLQYNCKLQTPSSSPFTGGEPCSSPVKGRLGGV